MNRVKTIIKENKFFCSILLLYIVTSIVVLRELGFNYNINSDDISYINSGIEFYKNARITMHGVISAQIMPGLTFIIALFCHMFGTGSNLMISLKILYLLMSFISFITLYKISRLYASKIISSIVCLFLFSPDFMWMNNLILTETPYLMFSLLTIYHSLKFIKERKSQDYYLIILFYICCLYIRPSIALLPFFLIIILLLKRYDFKDLIKKCVIAGTIVLLFLTPWIYRNYAAFNKFIPLTYGIGNPLLLGTYQGKNYPLDEEINITNCINEKTDEDINKYLNKDYPYDKFKKYYSLLYDKIVAECRMKYWWETDKISMIKSYLIYKPIIMFISSFYWDELFGISDRVNVYIHIFDFLLFIASSIIIIISRRQLPEFLFIVSIYIYNVALYSYTFAYGRYAITLYPLRFIIIAWGLNIIYKFARDKIKIKYSKKLKTVS